MVALLEDGAEVEEVVGPRTAQCTSGARGLGVRGGCGGSAQQRQLISWTCSERKWSRFHN
jgi:hypothetical protein